MKPTKNTIRLSPLERYNKLCGGGEIVSGDQLLERCCLTIVVMCTQSTMDGKMECSFCKQPTSLGRNGLECTHKRFCIVSVVRRYFYDPKRHS